MSVDNMFLQTSDTLFNNIFIFKLFLHRSIQISLRGRTLAPPTEPGHSRENVPALMPGSTGEGESSSLQSDRVSQSSGSNEERRIDEIKVKI